MPQCQLPVFYCFWFQESQKINILGIRPDKSQSCYFPGRLIEPEGELERGHRVATPPLGAGPPWPRQGMVWAPGQPPTLPLSPIYLPRGKNPRSSSLQPRKVLQHRRHRTGDSGDRKSLFRHPAGTGKCPRSHLHRLHRHLHRYC